MAIASLLTVAGLWPALAADQAPTIHVAGDSTAAVYPANEAPRMGWAQVLDRFFRPEVRINDAAKSGRSSLSFETEGHFQKLFASVAKGDYVLIQFGHNDEKKDDPQRYTDPAGSFPTQLAKYVAAARAAGATPILLTPIERRNFGAASAVRPSHGNYPQAVRDLAKKLDLPLIDLTASTTKLLETAGIEGSKALFLFQAAGADPNYPRGVADNTHLQEAGAVAVAQLVVAALREQKSPLAQWLR